MNLSMVRGLLGRRPSSARHREVSEGAESSKLSLATQPSEASDDDSSSGKPLPDAEMLRRAREAHDRVDFTALAVGPNAGGPWKRVEAANRFVVFRRQDSKAGGLEARFKSRIETAPEVLCAGRLDACIEEMLGILCPRTGAEHSAVMTALYAKRFLCGSVERVVDPCTDDTSSDHGEHLVVKTSSFAHSTLFGPNEQWCYADFFQRKSERDGFTVSQNSLGRHEPTPGRITRTQTRVDQLHDLTAALLVDLDPSGKGLRVVYNAKFLSESASNQPTKAIPTESPTADRSVDEIKAQARRLEAMARGVTKLPELVRHRRFGFQLPADLDAIDVSNPRCPCCTRSLSPVKLSLSVAASAISNRSLSVLRTDTRRCYLCGYLVCIDCWSPERMESLSGRVAAIIVCRRCRACVDACDYSDIATDRNHGPARVVEDPPESTTASLLVDFLAESLNQAQPGSSERSNVFAVVRTLLDQDDETSGGEESDDNNDGDGDGDMVYLEEERDADAVAQLDEFLRDESKFPLLEACTLGNAERRSYVLDLPDDPENSVPRGPMPSNEGRRLSAAKASGLLQLADQLAPAQPRESPPDTQVDVRDLELICQLAAKTVGCSNAMISVMSASHEHVLASTNVNFKGAAVPRDYTMCQHQLMSQDPLVLIHPEADVRLQPSS
ncbi:hypothetical protein PR003_g18646 [Phytophthora rubi]|uniref:FYVE-type domain-containing protein n=1 Tax=Phytophthora rubi TaxID=129364 RepID=A0A6A3K8Z9_9STRA|nr:hypothetical protein PR002_g18071 [Phytophthora rubi]KAE9004130.1 hypothetical protein PR001_g17793 [Phytophthora rubi]KAE9316735.1 hypothetical protein PR003_g18646 [Phytophthora rubi]